MGKAAGDVSLPRRGCAAVPFVSPRQRLISAARLPFRFHITVDQICKPPSPTGIIRKPEKKPPGFSGVSVIFHIPGAGVEIYFNICTLKGKPTLDFQMTLGTFFPPPPSAEVTGAGSEDIPRINAFSSLCLQNKLEFA